MVHFCGAINGFLSLHALKLSLACNAGSKVPSCPLSTIFAGNPCTVLIEACAILSARRSCQSLDVQLYKTKLGIAMVNL